MTFADAVKTVLSKYADFTGRARRSEYWWFVLFTVLVGFAASIIDSILGTRNSTGTGLVAGLANLALLLPSLAVGARRLHDTGRSGWWLLLIFAILIGWIILIVWYCQDSDAGDNQYGPSPKAGGPSAPEPGYPSYPPPA